MLGAAVAIILLLLVDISAGEDTVVTTPLGRVRGLKTTDRETGTTLFEFRGIRYGKPPTGQNRFKIPKPVDKWDHVYDATHFGYACVQAVDDTFDDGSRNQSEDCLFLNVYVPRSLTDKEKLSVMVWIHGGGFFFGNAHFYDGTRIAVDGDVVVVTVNYRLGVLGFLSLYHPAARGNYGLWDQRLALQWVHDNIEAFRGNPDSVTIFGESAGSYSVSFQSLIPANRGLFQRVIAMSGVAARLSPVQPGKESARRGVARLTEKTGCSASDYFSFIDCLRNAEVGALLSVTNYFENMPDETMSYDTAYGVTVDGELFPAHPIKLLEDPTSQQSDFFRSLDFIVGTTSQEGGMVVGSLSSMPQVQEKFGFNVSINIPADFICKAMVMNIVKNHYNNDQHVYDSMCKFYTIEGSVDEQSVRAADLVADLFFTPATAEMLNFHSCKKRGRTYQYQVSRGIPWFTEGITQPEWLKGCGHGEELAYLFPTAREGALDLLKLTLTGLDKEISKILISMWTSFAKTGVPTAGEGYLPWLEYDPKRKIYLDIGGELSLCQNLKSRAVKFWTEDIPSPNLVKGYEILHDEL